MKTKKGKVENKEEHTLDRTSTVEFMINDPPRVTLYFNISTHFHRGNITAPRGRSAVRSWLYSTEA